MTLHNSGNPLFAVAPLAAVQVNNTAYNYLGRLGSVADKTLTISGTPTGAQHENIYQVFGAVEILMLFGHFYSVTDVSAITVAYIDLWDGTLATEITDNTGVNLSGASQGSLIYRDNLATTAMSFLNSSTGKILDGGIGLGLLAPVIALQKSGVATYIRFNYTSDGGGCDCEIRFNAIWRPLVMEVGSLLTVA